MPGFKKLAHWFKRSRHDDVKPCKSHLEPLEDRCLLAGRGLTGYYFDGTDFTQRMLVREDTQINFNWTGGTPSSTLFGANTFGVHWSGRVMPKFSETHNFYTRSTGGVKLWVNNKLIINDPTVHTLKDNKGSIALKAGERYDIRIEYFDTGSKSRMELHWMSARQAREVIPTSRLFASDLDTTPPAAVSHLRPSYLTDSAFKVVWKAVNEPWGAVYEPYIGRTRLGSTRSTEYTRGGRTPLTDYSVSVNAVDFAGNVSSSNPLLVTTLAPVTPGNGSGIAGSYFAAADFSQFSLTRTDSNVLFSWNGSPLDEGNDQPFSVRWDGRVLGQYDEQYTFYLQTEDAAKLWVGSQLLLNVSGPGEYTATSKLHAGQTSAVRIEYQHDSGAAGVRLSWSSLSTKKQTIPRSQLFPGFVDTTDPTPPGNLREDGIAETSVGIRWDPAGDDIGVARYDVYRNGGYVGSTNGTVFSDGELQPDTEYQYHVLAYDGASHSSGASNILTARTRAANPIDAFSVINAIDFGAGNGVTRSGNVVTSLDDGDWIRFERVNFGAGANSVALTLGVPWDQAGGEIELRLDAPDGALIGVHVVQATGDYDTQFTQQLNVNGATGSHDLYLVVRGQNGVANLQSLQFSTRRLMRIMALGDSITASTQDYLSYRYYLWHRLQNAGYGLDFVGSETINGFGPAPNLDFDQDNQGHPGYTADQVRDNIENWAQQANPDIVLLHIGTNDIWSGQSASSTVNEIDDIIDILRNVNPSVKIILAQILPIQGYSSGVNSFNSALASFASGKNTANSPVVLVNMNSGFSTADQWDGVHLNDAGEAKMADRWYDALVGLLA